MWWWCCCYSIALFTFIIRLMTQSIRAQTISLHINVMTTELRKFNPITWPIGMWHWSICGNGFVVVVLLKQIWYWKLCVCAADATTATWDIFRNRWALRNQNKTKAIERKSKSQNVSSDCWHSCLIACLLARFSISIPFLSVSCYSTQFSRCIL